MDVCMYACIYVCMHVCVLSACMQVWMHAGVHVCAYACMQVGMHAGVRVCPHACMYGRMSKLPYCVASWITNIINAFYTLAFKISINLHNHLDLI